MLEAATLACTYRLIAPAHLHTPIHTDMGIPYKLIIKKVNTIL